MLGRDHHRGCLDRLAVNILQSHLAFGVGTEPWLVAGVAGVGHGAQDAVGQVNRRRHQHVGLAASVAEHDALVAGALVLVVAGIDALGDVARLGMDIDVDLGVTPMEAVLFVADIADRFSGGAFQVVVGDAVGAADLAGKDDLIGGDQGLHGDPRFGLGAEIEVNHRVGHPVADLVGMPFGNRLTGK